MHVDIYRCDRERCREEKPAVYPASASGDLSGPCLPDGWLSIGHWGFIGDRTFCSIDCLAIWARAERVRT